MAVNFPTTIDNFTNPLSSDYLNSPDHASQHANANDAIEALEAKVGVDSSSVNTSLDYKVKNSSSVDPGHKHSESALSLNDNTTSDVSTSKHGLCPKAPNDTSKFLRGDGGWVAPASGITVKNGISTKDTSEATGTQTIAHGLGKIPSVLRLYITYRGANNASGSSVGIYNGTIISLTYIYQDSSYYNNGTSSTYIAYLYQAGGIGQNATVTFDATNIYLNWTKEGSPTGNAYLVWEVEG